MDRLVVPHDPAWENQYALEAKAVRKALGSNVVAIHHIGSTSIPDILAKPIIDILIEVASLDKVDEQVGSMEALGYEPMGEFGIEDRRYFRRITSAGVRTHHVHVFLERSDQAIRHLAFRDYLRAHSDKAKAYSRLKAKLTRTGPVSWDDYIDGKQTFVEETEREAVMWYRARL